MKSYGFISITCFSLSIFTSLYADNPSQIDDEKAKSNPNQTKIKQLEDRLKKVQLHLNGLNQA